MVAIKERRRLIEKKSRKKMINAFEKLKSGIEKLRGESYGKSNQSVVLEDAFELLM
jgi:hypothetical protein